MHTSIRTLASAVCFAFAGFTGPAQAGDPIIPCIDLEKLVSVDGGQTWADADTQAEAVAADGGVIYRLVVSNCGTDVNKHIFISDMDLGIYYEVFGKLLPGESASVEVPVGDLCDTYTGLVPNTASVTGWANLTGTEVSDSDDAWVECTQGGGEGCTPGYWKQEQHFDAWTSPYTPETLFADVFARDIVVRGEGRERIDGPTLLQALDANGGNVNAAARHAVAALLNAASADVAYNLSVAGVIAAFQEAYPDGELDQAKDMLEAFNEQGCPLN